MMAEIKGSGAKDGVGESSSLPVAAERRRHARMPVEMWVEDVTDGGVVHRRAGNLSKGGLYLDQTIPLPIGSKVKLRFTLPEESAALTVNGQIVSINSRDRLGMGVKFTDVDVNVQQRIDNFIERSITPPLGITSSTG
jgi:type IV pilus assembly protein PilZ